ESIERARAGLERARAAQKQEMARLHDAYLAAKREFDALDAALTALARNRSKATGTSPLQVKVLEHLREHPDSTQLEISEALGKPRSSIGHTLPRLERAGLVRRTGYGQPVRQGPKPLL